MKTLSARHCVCDCAILFFILSFFGWCAETALFLFRWNVLADRGFLTLPFCTIYGTAVLAEHFLLGTPQTGRLSPLWKKGRPLAARTESGGAPGRACPLFCPGVLSTRGGGAGRRHPLYRPSSRAAVELLLPEIPAAWEREPFLYPALGRADHAGAWPSYGSPRGKRCAISPILSAAPRR